MQDTKAGGNAGFLLVCWAKYSDRHGRAKAPTGPREARPDDRLRASSRQMTRPSIFFARLFGRSMDTRVKPAYDELVRGAGKSPPLNNNPANNPGTPWRRRREAATNEAG
jgi:hypothetical protein